MTRSRYWLVAVVAGVGLCSVGLAACVLSPSPPQTVHATAGNGAATVTWSPGSGGSYIVMGYVVTPYKDGVAQSGVNEILTTSAVITGLSNGHSYAFAVATVTTGGRSGQSVKSNTVVPSLPPVTLTFNYDGTDGTDGLPQTWGVPAGVASATFDVYGAAGGQDNSDGGKGGEATATVNVSPGDTVTIVVGGSPVGPHYFVGGYNGGGSGGGGIQGGLAAGGGGASDVRIGGADLSHRAIVAGGGGGSGPCDTGNINFFGGAGGGLTGGDGGATSPPGGEGGNQDGTRGSGVLGSGSHGMDATVTGGGGGGGGYYGGAGGGGDCITNLPISSGGGGGSGFGPPGVAFHTGVRQGNGLVTVTYTPTASDTLWTQQSPTASPSPRAAFSMAYDPALGHIVVFGGAGGSNDTWEFTGTTWVQLFPATHPTSAGCMAWDEVTQRLVLFTGAQTWLFDGSNWSQASPSTSPADRGGPCATDPTGHVLLFGGLHNFQGVYTLNDTWRWNGSSWDHLSPASMPPGRTDAAMGYDAARHKTVLFGGEMVGGATQFFNDTWEWNGSTWSQVSSTTAPPERRAFSMAFSTGRGATIMFGGIDGSSNPYRADTWEWDGSRWADRTSPYPTSPPAGLVGLVAYDPALRETVFFGSDGHLQAAQTWTLADHSP